MKNTRTRTTKAKLEETFDTLVYAALYIANKILTAASVIFCLLSVCATGDGKMSNGDPGYIFMFIGLCLCCALAAHVTTLCMNAFITTVRRKNRKRRRSVGSNKRMVQNTLIS